MIAVIMIKQVDPDFHVLNRRYSSNCMLPVLDRPFLQHIIMYLSKQGISEFSFFMPHFADDIQKKFSNDSKWGKKFSFHLIENEHYPYEKLSSFDQDVLVVNSDCLISANIHSCKSLTGQFNTCVCYYENDIKRTWSGWFSIPKVSLNEIAGVSKHRLPNYLQDQFCLHMPSDILHIDSNNGFLKCSKEILTNNKWDLVWKGQEIQPGVWVNSKAKIHPSVKMIRPVYIGHNAKIKKNVVLGPNTILGKDCVIDENSTIENSVILQNSLVGKGLDVRNTIIDKNFLVNTRLDTALKLQMTLF